MSLIFYPIIVFYIFLKNSMYCGTKFLISILCTCSSHSIHFIVVITHYKPYLKKVRRRKSGQSSLSLEANLAAKSAKKNSVKQNDKKLRINSNSRSLSQRCKSQRHENSNDIGEGRYGFMIALCMPLISLLLVLICWGTFFSILCTSMGLFLIRWSLWTMKIDSDEYNYKKRIIREGLLQRNRTRPFWPRDGGM